ncbi:MAG TPA: hypothetical protein VHL30_02400 [Chlamydiales bacterium]|jgi:hypothetical protein|nr:hypothetical protein [Chlamydiales bacterium]
MSRSHAGSEKTKNALLWMSLSNEPFVVLYAILPFIIRKDLDASLVQLSILASLRPFLSIFSFYWGANLTRQRHLLRSNLIGAWLLARLPFLFVPWINHAWYIIFCCSVYELLNRSGNPALIELLKINLQKEPRERIYNLCFILSFLESILLGFLITGLLNKNVVPWPILLGMATLVSLSSILPQMQVPLPPSPAINRVAKQKFLEKIITPWKDAFTLLKLKPDFSRFQCGFMLGGIGLMLASPSLSLFCVDFLRLSHSEITFGRSVLMGVGVVISSYFWRRMISNQKTEQLLTNILVGFSLYLFCLYLAGIDLLFFYFSFVLYGIAQAGSHLLWNLSGALFAGSDDSSQFSRVNILMVGLRGSIVPALGGFLCNYFGPGPTILFGSAICFSGACYMLLTKNSPFARNVRIFVDF